MNTRLTQEQFLEKAKQVHGDKYNYSEATYIKANQRIKVICYSHGEWYPSANTHLMGYGCPKCGHITCEKSKLERALAKKYHNVEQPLEYKMIPLGKGKFSLVDNEDFEKYKNINWHFDGRYATSNSHGHMHRVILNCPSNLHVDHINGWGSILDNRKTNLRICTAMENTWNKPARGGTSKYKGVTLAPKTNKWYGRVRANNITYRVGTFDDEIECAKAVDFKTKEVHKEFAYLNFPNE